MKLRQLFSTDEERAVSPVIGVILMVAITVILAAVIGTFVLGLGDQVQTTAPNTQFTFDYAGNGGDLTVTHDGGDAIKASQLSFAGDKTADWSTVGSASGSNSRVIAGDSATLTSVATDASIRVVWQSESGDSSSTVARWSGPDA